MKRKSVKDIIEDLGVLAEDGMMLSYTDLTRYCGLTPNDIKKLMNSGNLTKWARGAYKFKDTMEGNK